MSALCVMCNVERMSEDRDFCPVDTLFGLPSGWHSTFGVNICGPCYDGLEEDRKREATSQAQQRL